MLHIPCNQHAHGIGCRNGAGYTPVVFVTVNYDTYYCTAVIFCLFAAYYYLYYYY